MATLDGRIRSAVRSSALAGMVAASSFISAGCSPPSAPSDYSFTMPEVATPDALKAQDDGTRTAAFFRIGGTYLGMAKYTQDKEGSAQVYSPATLKEQGITLDEKTDTYYAIRQRTNEGAPGKFIRKPAKISEKLITIPATKENNVLLVYLMKEPLKDDDAAYAKAIGKAK